MVGREITFNIPNGNSWGYEFYPSWLRVERTIRNREEVCVILPLYCYDLCGDFTISTQPYPNEWESGQCGYYVINKQEAREFLGLKKITQKDIKTLTELIYERYRNKANNLFVNFIGDVVPTMGQYIQR